MGGLFLLGGLSFGIFALMPVILVLALLVILALRHDDDVTESRAPAIYGAIIAFVGLLTLLLSLTGMAASLADLADDDDAGFESRLVPSEFDEDFGGRVSVGSDDADDDQAVLATIGFLVAGAAAVGVLAVHRSLFARRRGAVGAARRVHRAYLLVLCLTMAIVAMVAGAVAVYQLFRAIAPDIGDGDRGGALRALVPAAVAFAVAAVLWQSHWKELDLGAPPSDEEFRPAAAP